MKAIGRLSQQEAYDRVYRFRVASHASVLHRDLPKEQWVTKDEVCHIFQVCENIIRTAS